MTKDEFNQNAVRNETGTTISYDVRPFGPEQQEAVAVFLGEQVFRRSIGALNTSKSVVLLVDGGFESTAQLEGFVGELNSAGLHVSMVRQPIS